MANSSRPFDRLEESAAKRPRSAGEAIFARPSESGSESRILVPGAYFSHQQHEEIVAQYRIALAELTFNSKPIITNLSIIAGDNLHAAEAIVATICAYIVESWFCSKHFLVNAYLSLVAGRSEKITKFPAFTYESIAIFTRTQVPIEQKLPSLYLLDSIVKNVGGDYIKYFAVKLPEVFCKVYRQVDSSTHSGMRHLFETWKGVFPPQSLQVIEDELGFPPAGSDSSAASTISPGSQFQGPPHRIHVNPKYLEAREQLQPSSMANVIANNYSGIFLSSNDEVERKDGAAVTSSRRSLADPRLKIRNIQCPQRDSFHEENIGMTQWNYDYGSGLPKHWGLEIGRAVERNLEQRSVKHGDDAMTRSCSGLSWNWVKSAKEEFMRDDISRSGYRSTLSNSCTDSWAPNNREALGHEHFLLKPRTTRDSHSGVNKEASPYSWSTEHRDQGPFGWTESPSALEPHSSDVFIRSSSNRIMPGSAGLLGNQQHSLDQTHLSSQCLPHQESRKSQLSGPLNIRLHNRVSGDPRMIGRSSSDRGNLSAKEVTEQSDTSRLLASILQSRIIAENSNTDSVSSLLSSFPSNGLISASKMESPISVTREIPNQLLNSSTSILTSGLASVSSILTNLAVPDLDELSKPACKSSGGLSQSMRGDVKALIGFEFKPDAIRQLHPCVISGLLDGVPHWCSICGLKFKYQTQLQRHLDCHELRIDSSNKISRRWYPNSTDWISGKSGLSLFCGPTTVLERNEVMVPADESQCLCVLCGEIFEDVYSYERDKWMFKGASYMAISMTNDESETSCQGSQILIVHSSCKLKSQVQDCN